MTKNSIDYITKKHFRSFLSVIVALTAVAAAALAAVLSLIKGLNLPFAVFAGFAFFCALFSLLSLFSAGKGCTLMRIAISVNAIVCFFSGMGTFTLGYLILRQKGAQDWINGMLGRLGCSTIATQPEVTGALLFGAAIILYFASGCAFFGHRYLGAARSCSEGTLKRSGFRVFPLMSFILFFFLICAAAVFFMLSGESFVNQIASDMYSILTVALAALLMLHLLLSGICARAFARKTFAFKVFEKQIMKVETNADGTVYVPINEDKEPDAEEPLVPSKKPEKRSEDTQTKQFIKEFQASPSNLSYTDNIGYGEGDLI